MFQIPWVCLKVKIALYGALRGSDFEGLWLRFSLNRYIRWQIRLTRRATSTAVMQSSGTLGAAKNPGERATDH